MAIEHAENIVTIAVFGATGTGKTTFVNQLSNSGFQVGHGLLSCTTEVQVSKEFTVSGREVQLIDTPGFDDTIKTDKDILRSIAAFLTEQYSKGTKLQGIVYMHRISDTRVGGVSRKNFTMFKALCGDPALKNVVLVTNMWGEVPENVGLERERELQTDNLLFKPALDKGARMIRHSNTLASAQAIVASLISNSPQALGIQSEMVGENKALEKTSAGMQLENEALADAQKKHEEELRRQKEIADEAQRKQEEQRAKELERVRHEKAEAEARARAEEERIRVAQEAARRLEEQRQLEIQQQQAAEAEARRKEEERVRQLQEELRRQEEERQREEQQRQEELARLQREAQHRPPPEQEMIHALVQGNPLKFVEASGRGVERVARNIGRAFGF